jgi:hypothetical protein
MRPRLLLALLVVASVAAGGCAGKAADAAKAPPTSPTATTGVLRGIVVDEAVRPLAGVNVTANGQGGTWNATSAGDGTFAIGGLQPGTYLVSAGRRYYSAAQVAVDVHAGVAEPAPVKLQLTFEARSVPYASVYKLDGFHECGFNIVRVCSNINIATWIVLCSDTGGQVCLGNVTEDHSLMLQHIDGVPRFLQSEMTWTPTLDTGKAMTLLIGGANITELDSGFAPAYNVTEGESPLMVRISNHEGPDTWCRTVPDPPTCTRDDVLNESKIGAERSLLVQVDAGPTYPTPYPGCDSISCGAGFSAQQPFTMFTTVFFGYEPPIDWLFTATGQPPPPPA